MVASLLLNANKRSVLTLNKVRGGVIKSVLRHIHFLFGFNFHLWFDQAFGHICIFCKSWKISVLLKIKHKVTKAAVPLVTTGGWL